MTDEDVKRNYSILKEAARRLGEKVPNRKKTVRKVSAICGVSVPATREKQYQLLAQFLERPIDPTWSGRAFRRTLQHTEVPKEQLPSVPKTRHLNKQAKRVQSDSFLASYEWRRLRMEVITERGARCECCGATPKGQGIVINVDHIKPRRDYPELALDKSNLQVLCGACNHGKGNWDQTDWRKDRDVDLRFIDQPWIMAGQVLRMQ